MDTINIDNERLQRLRTIKPDYVWTNGTLIFKKDFTFDRKKDYFEILKMYGETSKCVFPECRLTLNDRPFGYTTTFDKERNKLTKNVIKGDLFYRQKLEIIKELIEIVKDIHSVGLSHGDLHLDNILYSKSSGIRLIDFEESTLYGVTSEIYHNGKIKDDMSLLCISILSILSDHISTAESTYIPLIQSLNISDDFKDYLISSIYCKDKVEGIYPDEFLGEIKGDVESQARKLIRSLK